MAFGRTLGPSACGEFMRTDLAPMIAAPSSHFLPTSTPAFRSGIVGRGRQVGRSIVGNVLRLPVFTGSPPAVDPLPSRRRRRIEGAGPAARACVNMLSSVMSPISPEKISMWVTPGNVSLVHCGKSSMVISPTCSFSCCGFRCQAAVAAAATASGRAAFGLLVRS